MEVSTTDAGQALARELTGTHAGRLLALQLINTEAGQALARYLADSDSGQALALDLASTATGLRLALELANTPAGRDLALYLALDLARVLATTDADRELPRALATTEAGQRIALELATTEAGREFALDLAATGAGRRLARELANTSTGREFARVLAKTDAGREFARVLATTEADRELALYLAVAVVFASVAGGGSWAATAVVFAAGAATLRTPDDDETEDDTSPPRNSLPQTVTDLYQLAPAGRLDPDTADRVRGKLEPFLGTVESFLLDDKYPEMTAVQIEHELNMLRSELGRDNPIEPLGQAVNAYFTSLLDATLPLLDHDQLVADTQTQHVDVDEVDALVEAGTSQQPDPADVSKAESIADRTAALAPEELTDERDRLEWAATAVGWTTDTVLKGAGGATAGAGAATVLNLAWLSPAWAAVIGGVIGVANAIAKIVRDEDEDN